MDGRNQKRLAGAEVPRANRSPGPVGHLRNKQDTQNAQRAGSLRHCQLLLFGIGHWKLYEARHLFYKCEYFLGARKKRITARYPQKNYMIAHFFSTGYLIRLHIENYREISIFSQKSTFIQTRYRQNQHLW